MREPESSHHDGSECAPQIVEDNRPAPLDEDLIRIPVNTPNVESFAETADMTLYPYGAHFLMSICYDEAAILDAHLVEYSLELYDWREEHGRWAAIPAMLDTTNDLLTATTDRASTFSVRALPQTTHSVLPAVFGVRDMNAGTSRLLRPPH